MKQLGLHGPIVTETAVAWNLIIFRYLQPRLAVWANNLVAPSSEIATEYATLGPTRQYVMRGVRDKALLGVSEDVRKWKAALPKSWVKKSLDERTRLVNQEWRRSSNMVSAVNTFRSVAASSGAIGVPLLVV